MLPVQGRDEVGADARTAGVEVLDQDRHGHGVGDGAGEPQQVRLAGRELPGQR